MQIILNNSIFSVGILPNCGGSLSFFKWQNTDILRPCRTEETEANNTSLFTMIPYTSFIQDNHFPYFGITRLLEQNSPINKNALHGDVWRHQTKILHQTQTEIQLEYQHTKNAGFPFNYTTIIIYRLGTTGLEIELNLKNDSALPMPYGWGIHPFFVKEKSTKIQFNATHLWYREGDPIMGHPYSVPKSLQFDSFRSLPTESTDISVSGWDNIAKIQTNMWQAILTAETSFRHLNLFVPHNKKFFCLEPVTNTPNAFNLAANGVVGTGIQSLGPHESTQTKIQLSVKGNK